jgi:hypothetical protein
MRYGHRSQSVTDLQEGSLARVAAPQDAPLAALSGTPSMFAPTGKLTTSKARTVATAIRTAMLS